LTRLNTELKLEALHYLNREDLDECQESNREWKNIIVRYANELARRRVSAISFSFEDDIWGIAPSENWKKIKRFQNCCHKELNEVILL
jgi:hypothetical protein